VIDSSEIDGNLKTDDWQSTTSIWILHQYLSDLRQEAVAREMKCSSSRFINSEFEQRMDREWPPFQESLVIKNFLPCLVSTAIDILTTHVFSVPVEPSWTRNCPMLFTAASNSWVAELHCASVRADSLRLGSSIISSRGGLHHLCRRTVSQILAGARPGV
jgi:hypothetical protein